MKLNEKLILISGFFFWNVSRSQTVTSICLNAGPDQVICSSGQAILNGMTADSLSTVLWNTAGDGTFNDPMALNTNYTPGVTDIFNKKAVLILSTYDSSNSCNGATDTMVLTVHSIPSQPNPITGATPNVCPPVNGMQLQTNNDTEVNTYNWTSANTAVVFLSTSSGNMQTINILPTADTIFTVKVTGSNACGTSPERSISIRKAISMPVVTGPSVTCPNTTQTFYCNRVNGASSYKWYGTAGIKVNGNSGYYVTTDTSVSISFPSNFSTGTIYVSAMTPCFTSAYTTRTVSKSLPPLSVLTGDSVVCPNTIRNYSVVPLAGAASYTWTIPNLSTGSSTTNSITLNFGNYNSNSSLCVRATSVCGVVTSPRCKTILKNIPAMPGNITGPDIGICGQTVSYSVPAVQGITYNWTVPVGASINGAQNGNSIIVTMPSNMPAGFIRVSATNVCSTSALRSKTVKGIPATPGEIFTDPYPVYANTPNALFTSDLSMVNPSSTFTWQFPSSATYVSGQGTSNLVLDWGNVNGIVTIKASNTCGYSSNTYYVNINSKREAGQQNISEAGKVAEEEKNVSINLQAYPDADNRLIIFTFNATQPDVYSYNLNDESDRPVQSGTINAQEGVNMHELDMASLSNNSVYVLKLSDGKNSSHINIRLQ